MSFKNYNLHKKGQAARAAMTQLNRKNRRQLAMANRPQIVNIIQKSSEFKGLDTEIDITSVISSTGTNGDAIVLNLVRAGNGSYNRVGRKIHGKTLRLKGTISFTLPLVSDDMLGNQLRMVVVWDQQPSGVLPTFDTIFGHTEQDGAESSFFYDPRRYDNMDRFRVLKECNWTQNPTLLPTTSNFQINRLEVDEFIKLRIGETVYSSDSSPMTIADISTGAIYVYFRTFAASAGTVSVSLISRLRYTDN